MDPLYPALGEGFERVCGDVGLAEDVDVLEEHAGHVQSYVALADDDGFLTLGKIRVDVGVLGKAVVPADELAGGVDAL